MIQKQNEKLLGQIDRNGELIVCLVLAMLCWGLCFSHLMG